MARKDRILWILLVGVALTFLILFFLWPLFSLILLGIAPGAKFDALGVFAVLAKERTWHVVGQTILQSVTATSLAVLLGLPAAFMLYRVKFVGRKVVRALMTVPFVLPTVVVAAAFLTLYGPGGTFVGLGLDRSFTVLIMALTFFNVTVVMRVVGGFWENLDPRQAEAARMLGATPTHTFITVTLPSLWRPIASAAALVFLFCATSFGVVFVLGGKRFANVETEIYRATMQLLDLRTAAVLAIVQIVIVALALLLSAKVQPKLAALSTASFRKLRFNKAEHFPALLAFLVTAALLHLLPILSLIKRSFQNAKGEWTLNNYSLLFSPPELSPLAENVTHSIKLSLLFALVAMLLALVIGLTISLAVTRRTFNKPIKFLHKILEYLMLLPLGVSAVALGLGLLITMHNPIGIGFDLRSSMWLIPIAQTLIALPLVIRTILPRLQSVRPRVKEAATMLGASDWRIIFTVELPQLKNALAVAAGFAFAASLGEFGAAAFLVRGHDKTLPVVIAQLLSHQDPVNHGMGVAAAVLLGVLTAAVMVSAESLSLKRVVR